MNKIPLLITVALVAVSSAFAETTPTNAPAAKKPLTPAEQAKIKAIREQRFNEHTGGKIARPGSQKGEVVYVNCQKRADKAVLEESRAYFEEAVKFKITIKDGAFDFANPKIEGNASLFIVDDPALPPLLVAPENRWALVNVAPLAQGRGEKPAFFNARVKKELSRGFAALCGAMNSSYPGALMGGITATEQLDTFADARLSVDVISRFAPYMEPFGVTPAVIATYRNACKQGWAPAPTNDYQKKIWKEVNELPTEPLKLTK